MFLDNDGLISFFCKYFLKLFLKLLSKHKHFQDDFSAELCCYEKYCGATYLWINILLALTFHED